MGRSASGSSSAASTPSPAESSSSVGGCVSSGWSQGKRGSRERTDFCQRQRRLRHGPLSSFARPLTLVDSLLRRAIDFGHLCLESSGEDHEALSTAGERGGAAQASEEQERGCEGLVRSGDLALEPVCDSTRSAAVRKEARRLGRAHLVTPPSTSARPRRTSDRSLSSPPRLAACSSSDEWCLVTCVKHREPVVAHRERSGEGGVRTSPLSCRLRSSMPKLSLASAADTSPWPFSPTKPFMNPVPPAGAPVGVSPSAGGG